MNVNLTPTSDEWLEVWYPDDISIYHGVSFRTARQIHNISEHQAIVTAHVPDPMDIYSGRKAGTEPLLHSVVLDAALFGCGVLHWRTKRQDICVPSKIQKIVFGPGRLRKGEIVQIHIEKVVPDRTEQEFSGDSKYAVFNFTLRDSQGDVVYDIVGYTATVLKAPSIISVPAKETETVLVMS
jgi:hypothetical protein